jgi:general secretion pathway protein D
MDSETVATLKNSLPWTFALLCALTSILPAQDEKPSYKVDIEGDDIVMTVNENQGMPMKDFIKIAERQTGKLFVYPKTEVENDQSKILWIGTVRLRKEQFFAFFQTMLYIKGFACVIRGEGRSQLVDIISNRGQRVQEISIGALYVPVEDLDQYKHQTGVQVLTSINFDHLDATKASQQVRPFFTAGGGRNGLNFGNPGNGKSLLVQGYGPQVYNAYRLFKLVDIPEEVIDLVIETVGLVHAAAEELEPLLNDLLGDRSRQRPATGAPTPAAQQVQMKILAQVTTNILILSGTRDQVTEAKDLIAQLDRPLEESEGDSHIIRLQNVLAKELRETLKQFLDQEKAAEDQARTGQQSTSSRRPRRPVVVAHEESNKLLISAPATKFTQLRRMIEELDERQRQVLVECAIVELSTSDLKRFGIELGLLDTKASGDFTRPFGFSHFGQSNFEDTDDDGLPDTRLPDFDNPLTGFTGGIISGGDFAIPVLLNALQDDNQANVLSLPSVIVNNNENALIESREDRPTQQTNQGTATTQQSFGGFEGAGINLTISPSISSNNYLRLNVELEVSRFITAFDPNAATPGVKTTRKVKTQVTLPSGHTMVIGGVIEDQESTTKSGIPYLMDIPLLGWLFKTHATEKRKTNLYFFLTPHILDEDDFSDLDKLSTRKKLEAQHYIGNRRMEIVDPKWNPAKAKAEVLDDPGSTVEDLDRGFGFEFPNYKRPDRVQDGPGKKNAPSKDPAPNFRQAPRQPQPK